MFVTPGSTTTRPLERSMSRTRRRPRERDDDAVLDGQRAAGEAVTRAARDERDLVLVARADDRGDLLRRYRAGRPHAGVTAYWSSPSDS